jgi:hypothetical protein
MGHVATRLTENIEIGAVRIENQDGLEVVTMDNLRTVRNSRVSEEPRRWEVSLPMVDIEGGDTTDYDAVRQLWRDSERGLHTFDFNCFVEDEVFKVRFASPLQITAPAGHLRQVDTFTIVEDE